MPTGYGTPLTSSDSCINTSAIDNPEQSVLSVLQRGRQIWQNHNAQFDRNPLIFEWKRHSGGHYTTETARMIYYNYS